MRVWLRYVILCGPQLLCHTEVHDGSARWGVQPTPPPTRLWFLLSCFATFFLPEIERIMDILMSLGPLCNRPSLPSHRQ